MRKARILLLRPSVSEASPLDQSLGARLAATKGVVSQHMLLEEESFQRSDVDDLEARLRLWTGKILGVVGATNVPESTRLARVAESLGILCFVSNNNPAVRKGLKLTFHLGVPSILTSNAVAYHLLRAGLKRLYLLAGDNDFQRYMAVCTESDLKNGGAEVRCNFGAANHWLEDVRGWSPQALYLIDSEESAAISVVQSIRRSLPRLILILGRSLLRQSFVQALGPAAEGLVFVDMFERGSARTDEEAAFLRALAPAGIDLPTSNHGFGWDAMTLCGLALAQGNGDPLSAVSYLESGITIDGATGRYRFSMEDHNGRGVFNPTVLSQFCDGRIQAFEGGVR